MRLRTALAEGTHGVTLDVPSRLDPIEDGEAMLCVVDREQAIEWRFFFGAGLPLDLGAEHRDALVAEMRLHGRKMFDDVARTLDARAAHAEKPLPVPDLPDDFDPLVEVHDTDIDGAPGLTFVHRMALRPGAEIVMGHLLVPLRDGLFEARMLARDQTTGFRESTLLMIRMNAADGLATITRAEIDDPAHDATFPQHSLSRVRAALRWLTDEAGLTIQRPAEPISRERLADETGAFTYRPPPRFARTDGGVLRVSFCVTDGLSELRIQTSTLPASDLEAIARRDATKLWAQLGPMTLTHCQPVDGRPAGDPRLQVVVDGQGPADGMRVAGLWFVGPRGTVCLASLITSIAVPHARCFAELTAVLDSLEWADPQPAPAKKRRRWWWPFG